MQIPASEIMRYSAGFYMLTGSCSQFFFTHNANYKAAKTGSAFSLEDIFHVTHFLRIFFARERF